MSDDLETVTAAIHELADRQAAREVLALTFGGELAITEHDGDYRVKVGAVEVVPADDRERAVDEAAERIFASGILDEIAASNDGDGRDAMQDAVTIAHLAFGGQ